MRQLNKFDLNLLIALDVLLSERNVTRAADRLCVTQPAVSGSLQRLREYFDDPLLLRVGREFELTPKARSLIAPVRAALLQIENALEARATFDPKLSSRTFRVAMSDYCVNVFLPAVIRRMKAEAPNTRIVVESVVEPSFSRLEAGDLDVIITHGDRTLWGRHANEVDLSTEDLFTDNFVCAVSADHPIGETMTLDDYRNYPHAVAFFGTSVRTVEEDEAARQGIDISDKVLLPTFAGLILQLPQTTLIATVQSRMATLMSKVVDLRLFPPPVEMPTLRETLIWHERNDEDPGHHWFRGVLKNIGQLLR